MAMTSTERGRKLSEKRRKLGLKPWKIWLTDKERDIVKPMIERKLRQLRKE